MFQNIDIEEKEQNENFREYTEVDKKEKIKQITKKLFTKQNILMYILTFMLSTVSSINGTAPFGIAIFAAMLSNALPIRNNIYNSSYRDKYRIWSERKSNIHINKFSIHLNGINI